MLQVESGHNLLFAFFKQLPKMFISDFVVKSHQPRVRKPSACLRVRHPQSCLRIRVLGTYLSVRGLRSFLKLPSYEVLSWGLRSGVLFEALESYFLGMPFYVLLSFLFLIEGKYLNHLSTFFYGISEKWDLGP